MVKYKNGVVEANGDVFIIPNAIANGKQKSESYNELFNKILIEAGYGELPIEELSLIQVWIVSIEDLDTHNLFDHHGYYEMNGEVKEISHIPPYLPTKLFMDYHEGDVVDVVYPKASLTCNPDFDFILHLRLAQTEYRYKDFGRFEEILDKLLISYSANVISGKYVIGTVEV